MPIATPSRRFSFRLLAPLVALGILAGSCQSSRPSFSFQPVVLRAAAASATQHATIASAPGTTLVAAPATRTATVAMPVTVAVAPLPVPAPSAATGPIETVAGVAPAPARTATHAHRPLLHRAHPTAEVGLGTTVFGILGLITLPIALLGLLLSGGGLVWGIVAGAAALAILVAYLDPFGR